MILVPYNLVSLAEDDTIGGGKNIVAGASVNITKVSGGSAQIYSDEAGTTLIILPTVTDEHGELLVFIEPGDYNFSINSEVYRVSISGSNTIIDSWAAISSVYVKKAGQLFPLAQHTSGGLGGGTLMSFVGSVTDDGGTQKDALGGFHLKRINYTYVTSDMFGIDETGAIDVGSLAQTMVNNFPICKFPAGTYLFDTLKIPANRKVLTDGALTIFKQKPQAVRNYIIDFTGSNSSIESASYIGNISTDINEFNAAVNIQAGESGKPDLINIKVGTINATNIRGDALCIAAYSGYKCSVEFDNVTTNNVLRNGVSIIGNVSISGGYIDGPAVGLCHLDIEPEPYTEGSVNVRVKGVKGRCVGIQSADAAKFIDGVFIDYIDLDPAYATGSTPAYAPGLTLIDALTLRNIKSANIGVLKIKNANGAAIRSAFNSGELGTEHLHIGSLEISNCCLTTGTDYVAGGAIKLLEVDRLVSTVAASKNLFSSAASVDVSNAVVSLGASSKMFSSVASPKLTLAAIAGTGQVFSGATNAYAELVTAECDFFFSYCGSSICKNSTVTYTTAFADSGNENHTLENATINTVYTALGMYGKGYVNALRLGDLWIWGEVATGKLRILNGKPTSDSAGVVVGTQT